MQVHVAPNVDDARPLQAWHTSIHKSYTARKTNSSLGAYPVEGESLDVDVVRFTFGAVVTDHDSHTAGVGVTVAPSLQTTQHFSAG